MGVQQRAGQGDLQGRRRALIFGALFGVFCFLYAFCAHFGSLLFGELGIGVVSARDCWVCGCDLTRVRRLGSLERWEEERSIASVALPWSLMLVGLALWS